MFLNNFKIHPLYQFDTLKENLMSFISVIYLKSTQKKITHKHYHYDKAFHINTN
jgi:hypothetical protein